MIIPLMFLAGVNSPSSVADPPNTVKVESDSVVILAALLCAVICAVGLAILGRCTWLRRRLHGGVMNIRFNPHLTPPPLPPPPTNGLKKKTLHSLPKLTFNAAVNGKLADCAICLTEFADGDEIRVLPQCGHVFHLNCVDTWLGCHSSCPSCRQILVVASRTRCQKCDGLPATP